MSVTERIEYAVDTALERAELATRGTRWEVPCRPVFYLAAAVVDGCERGVRGIVVARASDHE